MGTSKQELSDWFDYGLKQDATHMIVVCDTYDHSDYPSYVAATEDVRQREKELGSSSMQRVMEVYKLSASKSDQLAERRAVNY